MTVVVDAAPVITLVPLHLIEAGDNDRTQFNETELRRLAASIVEHGLRQPVLVRPLADGRYQLVAGERRFRAHELAGLEHIRAIVEEMDDELAAVAMWEENENRVNLDPIDRAGTFAKWMRKFGWDARTCAEKGHVKGGAREVNRLLRLLNLIPDVQKLVRTGNLPVSYAIEMDQLNEQYQAAAVKALSDLERLPSLTSWRKLCGDMLNKQAQLGMFADGDVSQLWATGLDEVMQPKDHSLGATVTGLAIDPALTVTKRKVNDRRAFVTNIMADIAHEWESKGRKREAVAVRTLVEMLVATGRLEADLTGFRQGES